MSLSTQTTNLLLKYKPRIIHDAEKRAFQILELLGEGGQGRVYKIRYIDTPPISNRYEYVYKEAKSSRWIDTIIAEQNAMRELRRVPSVAPYITHTPDGFIRPLYTTISSNEIYKYGISILDGIKSLHASGWVHCDIKHDNFCLDARNQIIMVDLGSAQRINTFNVEILQTALFSINQRQKLNDLFAARPHLSPTIIDFYGFAWMMYRAIGGWAEPTWVGALPTTAEIRAWKPSGIHASLHPLLQDLFLEATIEQHAPPLQSKRK